MGLLETAQGMHFVTRALFATACMLAGMLIFAWLQPHDRG